MIKRKYVSKQKVAQALNFMMVTNVFVLQDILEKIVNLALICVRDVHKLDAKVAIFVIFLIQITFVVLALQIAYNVIRKLNA